MPQVRYCSAPATRKRDAEDARLQTRGGPYFSQWRPQLPAHEGTEYPALTADTARGNGRHASCVSYMSNCMHPRSQMASAGLDGGSRKDRLDLRSLSRNTLAARSAQQVHF